MRESVPTFLERKADQVKRGAEILLQQTSDWQQIKKYLCNRIEGIKLSASQKEKLDRYQFIYNQLSSGNYTEQEILQQLQKKEMYDISLQQAYDDMNATKEIFSSFININKKFELKLELDIAKEVRRKCLEQNDMKSYAAMSKNIISLLALIEDDNEVNADLFTGIEIEATFDPRLLNAPDVDMKELLTALNNKRDAKIKMDLIEDLPYESITNAEEAL